MKTTQRTRRTLGWMSLAMLPLAVIAGPAVTPALEMAKPGAVRPEGWLLKVAQTARDGYTGHMDEVDVQFARAWKPDMHPRGAELGWEPDTGAWGCEGGAYWFDGLVKLAAQLGDRALLAMASNRLDTVLNRMHPNAIGFVWWMDRRDPKQVEEMMEIDAWHLWVAGMFARPLCAWFDVSGDPRVPRALSYGLDANAYDYWTHQTLPSGAYEAYRRTRSEAIGHGLDVYWKRARARKDLSKRFSQYLDPPPPYLEETLNLRRRHHGILNLPSRHGVMATEALLSIFDGYMWTGDTNLLASVRGWYAFFDRHARQPYGVTAMDEEWGHPGPTRGTETCTVAAEEWNRINLMAALGEGAWGDDVERNFLNAGRTCMTDDYRRHVYLQQPNHITASDVTQCSFLGMHGDRLAKYETKHWPLCCTAALNRILPNYIASMWMLPAEGGVAATLYGPCRFAAELPGGAFEVVERTDYPNGDRIVLEIARAPGGAFPIRLRIPGWCAAPELAVNGEAQSVRPVDGFASVERPWRAGDRVTLRLPMTVRVERMIDRNDVHGREYASISLGPVLYALPIASKDGNTPEREVTLPVLAADFSEKDVRVGQGRIRISDAKGVEQELVPYAQAKLRVSMFPLKADCR